MPSVGVLHICASFCFFFSVVRSHVVEMIGIWIKMGKENDTWNYKNQNNNNNNNKNARTVTNMNVNVRLIHMERFHQCKTRRKRCRSKMHSQWPLQEWLHLLFNWPVSQRFTLDYYKLLQIVTKYCSVNIANDLLKSACPIISINFALKWMVFAWIFLPSPLS